MALGIAWIARAEALPLGSNRSGTEGKRMFESLQERLGSILNGLTGRGALSEADVSAALREVRRALLEADVALLWNLLGDSLQISRIS